MSELIHAMAFILSIIIPYALSLLCCRFILRMRYEDLFRNAGLFVLALMSAFLMYLGCDTTFRLSTSVLYGFTFWLLQYILDKQKVIDFKKKKQGERKKYGG